MSNVYPGLSNTTGIDNASWTQIVSPATGRGYVAKVRDASSWKLSLDSTGAKYFSVLSEWDDFSSVKLGQVLFYAQSDDPGPFVFEVLVYG